MPNNISGLVGGPKLRTFDDIDTTRQNIFDGVLSSLQTKYPIENSAYRLELDSVRYDSPKPFSLEQQKKAILSGKSLNWRLKGKWRLVDKATGTAIDEKDATVAHVPYLTNRGTFIHNGNEYTVSNQMRLRPGVYARRKENEELESHFNLKGMPFRVFMEPDTGVFFMRIAQSKTPLFPVLKGLGVTDNEIKQWWGNELHAINAKRDDPLALKKVFGKFAGSKAAKVGDSDIPAALREHFAKSELDPAVTQHTLGKAYTSVTPEAILRASQKLVQINKGEADTDDRDSLAYQSVYGLEDFFKERIQHDAGATGKRLLWKSTFGKSVQHIPTGALTKHLNAVLLSSGLGQPLEEINPMEVYDQLQRISRLGQGGIPSLESVPDEARNIQSSYVGFIDPSRTPECFLPTAQIFTKSGWKSFDTLCENDLAACNIGGRLEFHNPSAIHRYDYDGLMYGMLAPKIAYLTTPEHRHWCRVDGKRGKYRFETAKSIHSKGATRCFISTHEPYSGTIFDKFSLPESDIEVDCGDWAEFIGWYISEGCAETGRHKVVRISQCDVANPENCVRIAALLDKLPFKWKKWHRNYTICNNKLSNYLIQFGKSYQKYLPDYVFDYPLHARLRLFDALMRGDGHCKNINTRVYHTVSHRLAKDVERLAISLGWSAKIHIDAHNNRKNPAHRVCYVVQIHDCSEHYGFHRKNHFYTKHYTGKVYCATVPGGLMYVRNDPGSIPFWTGNSGKVGIDSRIAYNTHKGDDGQLYSKFINPRTGKQEFVSGKQAIDSVIAFPGELARIKAGKQKEARAMINGKIEFVDPSEVDYEIPITNKIFSTVTGVIPGMSSVKSDRVGMGTRMTLQALALKEGESPLVRSAHPDGGSFESNLGKYMGAVHAEKPGTVQLIRNNTVHVKNNDGTTSQYELYNNFPFNRKSFIHSTPMVKVGDKITSGQLVARSNFTDDKGVTALGKNLHVGYMPFEGSTFEDAIVISESAAKKLTSEHMYQEDLDLSDMEDAEVTKRGYRALYAAKYPKEVFDKYGDDGVIRPGMIVNENEPLILAIQKSKPQGKGAVTRLHSPYQDVAVKWEHSFPGEVTDVFNDGKTIRVAVKAYSPANVGDKLCYSSDTEALTARGWVNISDVKMTDKVASLNPATGYVEYLEPSSLMDYAHSDGMYFVVTNTVDLLVTDNHQLYARNDKTAYRLRKAERVIGTQYYMKAWAAADLPEHQDIQFFGRVISDKLLVNLITAFTDPSTKCTESSITFKTLDIDTVEKLVKFLDFADIPVRHSVETSYTKIDSPALIKALADFGVKPGQLDFSILQHSKAFNAKLFSVLMHGAQNTPKLSIVKVKSKELADIYQVLAMYLGHTATVERNGAEYTLVIYKNQYESQINVNSSDDKWVHYDGRVYCVELPKHHIMYVRRNGKPIWCGNSNRYGNKGVISKIVPDAHMIKDEAGNALDIIVNPFGVISRGNPIQMIETALGKVARKTGKPYELPAFSDDDNLEFALNELKKNGLSDTEKVYDPARNRYIPKVFVGDQFFMKLHHSAEGKASGRSIGSYTQDQIPARGGHTGSKRVGLLELNALISHGATDTLRDIKTVRGTRNDEYWRAFRLGYPPPTPQVPFVYKKLIAMMQAAGVNVEKTPDYLNIMAMTDKDITSMSKGEIKNSDTVDFDSLDPIAGGLFDTRLTGGHNGMNWTHYKLSEPMPNPVMEDPIRKLLGLTQTKFENIVKGKEEFGGLTGIKAIQHALSNINVNKMIEREKEIIRSGSKSKRDEAAKKLKYLEGSKKTGIHPSEWIINNVPIIPPAFRPIARMGKKQLVSDPNYLYHDLMMSDQNTKDMKDRSLDAGESAWNTYQALTAVVGLGDPIQPKLSEKGVKGFLRTIFGAGGPKTGFFQHKVMGTAVDTVGRAVITPNPQLNMDQVGLPEHDAWEIYRNFVIRNLVTRGSSAVDAVQHVVNKSDLARDALKEELSKRPVVITRAPVLHKYGVMAAWPTLHSGKTLQVPSIICKSLSADFDGDCDIDTIIFAIPEETSTFALASGLDRVYSNDKEAQQFLSYRRLSMSFVKKSLPYQSGLSYYVANLEDFPYCKDKLIGTKDHIDFYEVPKGIKVIAYDEKAHKLVLADVHGWSVHRDREIWTIDLHNGRQIISDDDDRAVYGINPKVSLDMVRSRPVNAEGMMVPCAKSLMAVDPGVSISEIVGDGRLHDRVKLNKEFGYVVGALIGDGWFDSVNDIPSGKIILSGIQVEVIKQYKEFVTALFAEPISFCHQIGKTSIGRSEKTTFSSIDFARLVSPLIGKGAKNKHLPPFWFSAPREFKLGLLSGLLDTDGSISISNGKAKPQLMVNISSISLRLLQETQQLLATLSIRSTIGFSKTTVAGNAFWLLTISAPDLYAVKDELNNVHVKNRAALYGCVPDPDSGAAVKTDVIPIVPELCKVLMRKLGPKQHSGIYSALSKAKTSGYIARKTAKRLLEVAPKDVAIPLEWINIVNTPDVSWARVTKVENTGIKETGYDLTVPGYETFMSVDGIILSNTMNYHVPVSPEAVREASEKLMPSKNVLDAGTYDTTMFLPPMEYLHGLFLATRSKKSDKPVKYFATSKDAISAYRRGEVDINDEVRILEK